MAARAVRAFVLALCLLVGPAAAFGQATLPSPSGLPGAMQNATPDQLAQIQQQIQQALASGMTTDQIRQTLQANGYPATTLDAFLPGGKPDLDRRSRTTR